MTDPADVADRYRRLSATFAEKVAAVPADRWSAPTPCDGWTVADLVQHVVDAQGLFLGFVGRSLPDDLPTAADDPVAAWSGASASVQADLDDPERAGAEFDGIFGRQTFAQGVERFLCFDLVVHGLDLARAPGLDGRMPADEVPRIQAAAEAFGDAMRGPGAFGDALEPPADADDQDRLLAFLGRDPR